MQAQYRSEEGIRYSIESEDYMRIVEPDMGQNVRDAIRMVINEITSISGEISQWNLREITARYRNIYRIRDPFVLDYFINRYLSGLRKIYPLYINDGIEKIIANGYDSPVIVQAGGHYYETNIILNREDLDSIAIRISQMMGKKISSGSPIAYGTFQNFKALVTFGDDVTPMGSSVYLERRRAVSEPEMMSRMKSPQVSVYLSIALENMRSIVIIGPETPMKISIIYYLIGMISVEKKIAYIGENGRYESPRNVIYMSPREKTVFNMEISKVDLINTAMRQRPDFIIVNGLTAQDLPTAVQAITTGHTTISAMDIDNIENLSSLFSDPSTGLSRDMISLFDIVIQLSEDGQYVHSIYEYDRIEGSEVLYNVPFRANENRDLIFSGYSGIYRRMARSIGEAEFKALLDDRIRNYAEGRT
ncbi:type II/IV secretion system ATPase subunit [Thermoplasma sp. Kam2015]|uniref:type II/IV secretion system ATPase subunit n=1 Tax=Thermoplasma sp. Kam2015 TaxID=2094122 RepID=UPI00129330A7|nr:type II/IV secretion system ATPase subunit [Thermoplasma sp. Kam2015]